MIIIYYILDRTYLAIAVMYMKWFLTFGYVTSLWFYAKYITAQ